MTRLSPLALLLAAGLAAQAGGLRPLSQDRLAAVKAQAPLREGQALAAARAAFAADPRVDFALLRTEIDAFGQSHVRLQHLVDGRPVIGSELIAHLGADGALLPFTNGMQAVRLAGLDSAPGITPDQALQAAAASLAVAGLQEVFPPALTYLRHVDGLRMRTREFPGGGEPVFDRAMSLAAFRGAGANPHALVYRIQGSFTDASGETRRATVDVDAHSGQVLDKQEVTDLSADPGMEVAEALRPGPSVAAATAAASAVASNGLSLYSGPVTIPTTFNAGTNLWELRDVTRGTLANPNKAGVLGLQTFNANALARRSTAPFNLPGYFTSATGAFGDGTPFLWAGTPSAGVTNTPNGQTPAVDAHHAMTVTWDLLQNVFGRNGMDNLGTSWVAQVHTTVSSLWNNSTGTLWSDALHGLIVPSYSRYSSTHSADGALSRDVIGYSFGEALSKRTANFSFNTTAAPEAAGVALAHYAIFGKLVEFYGLGGGTGTTLPDFQALPPQPGADWKVYHRVGAPTSFHWDFEKPSSTSAIWSAARLNAWSPNATALSSSQLAGVGVRAYHFLAQGSSATKGDKTYSPWLQAGMTGIGVDKAARIYYRALTTKLTSTATHALWRDAALLSAQELYGAGSLEEKAVMNAFAAVGVGLGDGMTPEQRVLLTIDNLADQPHMHDPALGTYIRTENLLTGFGATFTMRHTLTGMADPTVSWSRSTGTQAVIDPVTGRVDVSHRVDGATVPVTAFRAVSNAEPEVWGLQRVAAINLDLNADRLVDGEDLGIFAATYGISRGDGRRFNPACQIVGTIFAPEGTGPLEAHAWLEVAANSRWAHE